MASNGESSLAMPKSTSEKPVVVRVQRKAYIRRLDGFWLEINQRPIKSIIIFGEVLQSRKETVLVKHVETLTTPAVTIDILQSFVTNSATAIEGKTRIEELAKHASFEQKLRRRKVENEEVDDMCHFYDLVYVDAAERELFSYLPSIREVLLDQLVYDYYTVKDDMDGGEDASHPFPVVRIENVEDFYSGSDGTENDSQNSNGQGLVK